MRGGTVNISFALSDWRLQRSDRDDLRSSISSRMREEVMPSSQKTALSWQCQRG